MSEILDTDNRWLKDLTPIDYKAEDIIFYDMKINWNFACSIEDMVKWDFRFVNKWSQKISFSDGIGIFDMVWNYFVTEYTSEEKRNLDVKSLKNNFKYDDKEIFAQKIEDDWACKQVPEFCWRFEYEWKFYIIVHWLNKLTEEIDSQKGVYKWVIVSPSSYFEGDEVIWWITDTFESEVDKNIK